MFHDRLDLPVWTARFPLANLRAQARDFCLARRRDNPRQYPSDEALESHVRLMSPGGRPVTSPADLAILEQLRAEGFAATPPRAAVPADIFVFSRGEPADRALTKLGGLPYLPAGDSWPLDAAGRPFPFLGQICFADSRDLLPDLPADVLLVFGNPDFDQYACRWVALGQTSLIAAEAIPPRASPYSPCFGTIHRTCDYPEDTDRFDAFSSPWQICVLEGTRIGGTPRWVQGEMQYYDAKANRLVTPRVIATLGSIGVRPDERWPFLNHPDPIPFDALRPARFAEWGDAGVIYLCFMPDGCVEGHMQCY